MTKWNENFKYERFLEQAGVASVQSCYQEVRNRGTLGKQENVPFLHMVCAFFDTQ